jgi:hypothetical protein
MSRSLVRADRIEPICSASDDWNTAMNRVIPSTISSKTMSALLRPCCGRADAALLILIASAGRFCVDASLIGRPVSG